MYCCFGIHLRLWSEIKITLNCHRTGLVQLTYLLYKIFWSSIKQGLLDPNSKSIRLGLFNYTSNFFFKPDSKSPRLRFATQILLSVTNDLSSSIMKIIIILIFMIHFRSIFLDAS